MSRKVNNKDISAPVTNSFQQLTTRIDSGLTLPEIATNEPFFDTSASQVGSPEQINRKSNPKKLTALQLSSYVQAVSAFKRQIQAMSAASEMFVRSCEALKESCPSTPSTQRYMADLDLLIDSTHLICNSHQIWAAGLAADVEEPLVQHLSGIKQQSARLESKNKARIEELTAKLHKEEDLSYKLGKKKQRDLATLQNSLNVRMSLADEIKRLTAESGCIQDQMCRESVELILRHSVGAVGKQIESFDTVNEGLQKLGAFDTPVRAATERSTLLDSQR